jgi:digeranylgeranylglycerophospholipid reductase
VYSPDHETKVLFEGEGYILNRKILPHRQVEDAKKLGVDFVYNVVCDRAYAESGFVRGVTGRIMPEGTPFKKTAKMVVDASGSATKLRPNLPISSKIDPDIDRDDLESTGRYIFDFEVQGEDLTWFDPRYALIHLDQYLAPGGYSWVFPKGKSKVNVGLGVQKKALDERNKNFGKKEGLQDLIDQYVAMNKVIKKPLQSQDTEDQGNTKGSWQVSVRRHNDCLVANGYAMVGDSAWMARPIDAGGIGPSIYASVMLGRVIAHAIEANDTSEDSLWQYNLDYMKHHGYQMASFEVLRRYLQTLTNDQISYGMKYFLSEDDISSIVNREHPKFSRLRLLNPAMMVRVAKEPKLAGGLKHTADSSGELIAHNMNYPEKPGGFAAWKAELLSKLQDAFKF